jgi:hypothetical protein
MPQSQTSRVNSSASSRRAWLKRVAAAATGPVLLLGERAPVLGSGVHTYEFVSDWAKTPASVQFGYTHGVAVDRQHRVIIHNRSKDAVAFFDENGQFIKSWGPEFAAGAHGLLLNVEDNQEFLYLADPERGLVAKTTLDGEYIWIREVPRESGVYTSPKQYKPTNVAVAPNGDVYVADGYGLSYIHQYNAKAEYIRTWGGKGSAPGRLDCPHGIWLDSRGPQPVLVVADRSNARLQYFSLDGQTLSMVTNDLRRPCHFDQRNGELLVPDLYGEVTILDKNNRLVTHLGDNPEVWKTKGWPNIPHDQRLPGKFVSPHAACWDQEGNILVVEWISDGRVTKLRRVA